jgi:hypothetical protein
MTDSTKMTGPSIFDRALAHIVECGWPDFAEDKAMADRLYEDWLAETAHTWNTSGIRDSHSLYDSLREALDQKHGEYEGGARWCVLSVLLEVRARDENQNQRRLGC